MRRRIDERLLSDSGLAYGLYPLSLLYGGAIRLWDLSYRLGIRRGVSLEKPVISVGNLVAGGSGKTGLTIALATLLDRMGRTVCVLSRGYRGNRHGVVESNSDPFEWGDEAVLLKQRLPKAVVVTGKDRVKTGHLALERSGADVVLLDDGYQFRRLNRDLNLLLVDCTNPFGRRRLLPSGLLREPVSSASRADVIVLTHAGQPEETRMLEVELRRLNGRALLASASYRVVGLVDHRTGGAVDPESIRGENVVVFSAIGNPRSFRKTVVSLETKIAEEARFPDHHLFTEEELSRLLVLAGSQPLITTEKDGVKLPPDFPCLIVQVEMCVTRGKAELERTVESLFN